VPIIALTATADRLTQRDIQQQLRLSEPQVFTASFDRPNLNLIVRPGQDRVGGILEFLDRHPDQPGIIYCLSRKQCETLSQKLIAKGYRAGHYHAGMTPNQRSAVQEGFLKDDLQVIIATIAFGMGIDKSNVRWVIHYNLPKNIEGYYQEIGRAGRDGTDATAVLFYSFSDVMSLREMLTKDNPNLTQLNLTKLERMQQFAEAASCRRKILLNYFGEVLATDCGNCDICRNPPTTFDGTLIAQKALSAVVRMRERASIGLLIDVLRGMRNQAVLSGGYDQIKTYGAGADLPYLDWYSYVHQMLNDGLLYIAYEEGYALKITELGKEVLQGQRQLPLKQFKPAEKAPAPRKREVGDTHETTFQLHRVGLSVEAIAERRSLSTGTVRAHIETLYAKGYQIRLEEFLTMDEFAEIQTARDQLGGEPLLRDLFDHLREKHDYFKLRLAVHYQKRLREA
jgi:ATP-dependent DNA helicase RecQ